MVANPNKHVWKSSCMFLWSLRSHKGSMLFLLVGHKLSLISTWGHTLCTRKKMSSLRVLWQKSYSPQLHFIIFTNLPGNNQVDQIWVHCVCEWTWLFASYLMLFLYFGLHICLWAYALIHSNSSCYGIDLHWIQTANKINEMLKKRIYPNIPIHPIIFLSLNWWTQMNNSILLFYPTLSFLPHSMLFNLSQSL